MSKNRFAPWHTVTANKTSADSLPKAAEGSGGTNEHKLGVKSCSQEDFAFSVVLMLFPAWVRNTIWKSPQLSISSLASACCKKKQARKKKKKRQLSDASLSAIEGRIEVAFSSLGPLRTHSKCVSVCVLVSVCMSQWPSAGIFGFTYGKWPKRERQRLTSITRHEWAVQMI